MSEEIQAADSLLTQLAERSADLELARAYLSQAREELRAVRADAAALMNIILDAAIWFDQASSADGSGHHDLAHRLRDIVDTRQYSGAALLTELAAARAVVTQAEIACNASLFDQRGPLVTAIARYHWTVQDATKVRSE